MSKDHSYEYDIIEDLNKLLNNTKLFDKNHGSYINAYKIFIDKEEEFNSAKNNFIIKLSI